MATKPNIIRSTRAPVSLDRIDREIVLELQKNARISNKDLAALVELSPSTCLERVRRLRERGVLTGFHAAVDPALLGRPTQALISVRLQVHHRHLIDDFYDHVLNLPASVAVFHVTGSDDYVVHVAVPDTERLRALVLDLTARDEVEHVETRLIFEVVRKPALEPL
ncbi:MAG: Lrp/AsnC family transcriptional regulator [Actinobacteria bacterium]|nr:Lrp/AsnC family transcriptional regulator [Actinomycetota bacterium]